MKFTQEQVESASLNSSSVKEFLLALGLKTNSGQYRRAKHIAAEYNVQLPKYDTKLGSKIASDKKRISDKDWFVAGSCRQGQRSKKRLIENFGWQDRCMIDGCPSPLPVWNEMPIVLQLDHIDGNDSNNAIDNLRIVCPNCHSQTETYSNKSSRV